MVQQRDTYLTKEGRQKLEAELEVLRTVRRQQVAERIQQAKEIGGTVDNAEYDEAKNEQAFVEGRIRTLEQMLNSAVMIPSDHAPGDVVAVGSRVSVEDGGGRRQSYVIVGSAEADPQAGRISNESPVGSALLGRHPGDEVEAKTPGGVIKLKIVAVE